MDIIAGLARAMGPLFQVERGTGAPQLLLQARSVLQETLGKMQSVDQSLQGVGEATAAIAQSLGLLFATIKEHNITDAPAPVAAPAPAPAPVAAPVALTASPFDKTAAVEQAPVPLVQPQAQPVPLVQPQAQPIPLVQPQAQPIPLRQSSPAPAPASQAAPAAGRTVPRAAPTAQKPSGKPSILPDTAAKVPVGANGLPRLEAELDAYSETNFFGDFVGDVRNRGGIFVATYSTLQLGTECEVALTFPGQLAAEVRGLVRWRRDVSASSTPGIGVEITHATADAWGLIDRYVSKREPIVYELG